MANRPPSCVAFAENGADAWHIEDVFCREQHEHASTSNVISTFHYMIGRIWWIM